jgi:DNA-binding transcriptional ArsR family regulator
MYQESNVLRNLAILKSLKEGKSSLEDIAEAAGYRSIQVERSMRVLKQQGLVEEKEGRYQLQGDTSKIEAALSLVSQWLNFANDSFYEIARDTAAIIHTKSYSKAKVDNVVLYGSILEKDNPRDIDLIIVHSGPFLQEFMPSQYSDEGAEEISDVNPGHPSTRRLQAWNILLGLGYADNAKQNETTVRFIGERIKELDAGNVSEAKIKHHMDVFRCSEAEASSYIDVFGVSNVFDVHVLSKYLLMTPELIKQELGERSRIEIDCNQRERKKLIEGCNDRAYWHSVLSKGKVYDPRQHDFTLTIEDKFPGALELFEVKPE